MRGAPYFMPDTIFVQKKISAPHAFLLFLISSLHTSYFSLESLDVTSTKDFLFLDDFFLFVLDIFL